ncbi:50S ribosomal protein L29 [Candidatus Gracilibacteria bacterium]|jgi:ribosomal protein L29|nr:50S ribosomal protein L29 [Candidatus Gracilibacteria bacterium]RKW22298.1 MAG: 50S ribosomal protein L29 [Candidatus Gracilibacteria bacterium]
MKEIKDLKLKDLAKLNELSEADLKQELASSSKNLYVLKMKKQLGEQTQTHLIKALRRYIARVKTIASSKGINI